MSSPEQSSAWGFSGPLRNGAFMLIAAPILCNVDLVQVGRFFKERNKYKFEILTMNSELPFRNDLQTYASIDRKLLIDLLYVDEFHFPALKIADA